MKINRIISICLIIMILSGCSSQTPSAVSETVDVSSAVSADTYMPEQTSTDIHKTSEVIIDITTTASDELSPSQKYTPSDEEKVEIQDLLTRSKKFFFEYIDCKEICKHKNENSTVTSQEIIDNGMYEGQTESKTWYEVADGEVMSFNDLNKKMDQIFTEKMIDSLGGILGNCYHEENGRLYISDGAGSDGGVLGTDTVYINSVGKMDENTFVLYMTAFGAGENWDLDFDIKDDFTVILKKTDSGLKIDECGVAAYQYIEWCYNSNDDMF